MARARAARRYAQAAFAIALERNELDRWLADLRLLAQVFAEPSLVDFLENPRFGLQTKQDLLGRRLSGAVRPLPLNLLLLLVAEGRVAEIGQVAASFEAAVNAHRGLTVAEVTTAVPLDRGAQADLAAHLARISGQRVTVQTNVDPGIVGGVVARMGDRLLDGSVRTRLEELRRRLAGTS